MGAGYSPSAPGFFRISPDSLKYAQIGAEALGYQNAIFALGDPEAPSSPVVVMLSLPPHGLLSRHAHDCWRFEVVISGSMQDEHGAWLRAGDIRVSKPGEYYGPHRAGPEGVLSAEVFSAASGVNAAFPDDLPDAEQRDLARAAVAVRAWMARPRHEEQSQGGAQ